MEPLVDYRQHLEVETPESVILDYEIAGVGSRALAAIIDTGILFVWILLLALALSPIEGWLGEGAARWARAILGLAVFASFWGYYTFFEGLRGGQTPGKRHIGIRVVRDTGHPVTFGAAAARNFIRLADSLPPPSYFLGGLFVALHPQGKRLGDIVAGTVVVRDRPIEAGPVQVSEPEESDETGLPELAEEEFRVIREFSERSMSLDEEVRARLADRLTARFADRFPLRPKSSVAFIGQLYRRELALRRGRFGAAAGRVPGSRRVGTPIDRLVARKQDRWLAFDKLANRAASSGLDSFAARELPDFAARYREVAADLARARTYRADPAVQARLERLVAAGHNALYRDDRKTLPRIWQVLASECPAAVVRARLYVLIAFLAFAAPAAGGYLLLRERPGLAGDLLPDVMLRRAEAGAERVRNGKGYVEIESGVRPIVASGIITNNIGVAFACFAGGIFLGVGSLFSLAYNGLSLGATAAHFANKGLLLYLLTFIVGHGVLELFSIWVAGAAGFMLGRSIVSPGDLTRGEALLLSGRLAIRMIGAVVILLLVAGSIEGFVSTSTLPLAYRLAVSGASAVFLVLYLANGARYRGSFE
ncbi:MAG: stage II sporulation protein M [Gemmatimonadota bacterium]